MGLRLVVVLSFRLLFFGGLTLVVGCLVWFRFGWFAELNKLRLIVLCMYSWYIILLLDLCLFCLMHLSFFVLLCWWFCVSCLMFAGVYVWGWWVFRWLVRLFALWWLLCCILCVALLVCLLIGRWTVVCLITCVAYLGYTCLIALLIVFGVDMFRGYLAWLVSLLLAFLRVGF